MSAPTHGSSRIVLVTIVALGAIVAAAAAPAAAPPSPALERGRTVTRQFYDNKLAELHGAFSEEMKGQVDLAKLTKMRQQMAEQLGTETSVIDEKVTPNGPYDVYVRKARFEKTGERTFELHFALRADRQVGGFFVVPTDRPPAAQATPTKP